jgi:hypothetical protein
MTSAQILLDKNGREIREFAVIKIFHFTGAKRKKHFMYKWVRKVDGHLVGQHLTDDSPRNWFSLKSIADKETGKIESAEIVQQYE